MNNKMYVIILGGLLIIFFLFFYSSNHYYKVSFDTAGGTEIADIKVKKGGKIKLPYSPKKDNYIFIEWQLNGKKYKVDKKVNSNITLKAYYLPKIYANVSFDTAGGNDISSISILSGLTIDPKTIKEPKKEGYNFDGWYYNDKPFDFKTKIGGNIQLVAHYSKAGVFLSYDDIKVGDNVLIIGNYASSTYDIYSCHKRAIGWRRKILKVYDDTNYPYQVGNEYGTTGFFKKESIKVIK